MPEPLTFYVVAEAHPDADMATGLADRVLADAEASPAGTIESARVWNLAHSFLGEGGSEG